MPGAAQGEASAPVCRRLDEAAAWLARPDAGESVSAVAGGPGVFVIDVSAPTARAHASAAVVLEALPWLPCVTIAVGALPEEGRAEALAVREACDVALDDPASVARFVSAFAARPIAALAFVQLLRAAPGRSIPEALFAESFVYSTLQSGSEFTAWLADRKRRRRGRRARETEGRAVRMERDRDRLEIYLTRATKHNAFSRAMRDGLCEALGLALADPSIETVVLGGDGDSFCSGGDLDEFGSFPDPAQAHAIRTTRSPALLLARLGARVRVEVQGACIGAGVELPAFTQKVVADEDAFFQLPEVMLGLVPGAGGTASLPRRIGRQRTAWLGLSGERIDARTALAWGVVDEVRLGQHVAPGGETRSR